MGVYEIKNLEISGEIKGAGHTGGITGYGNYNTTNIENCINRANISGKNMVGGIIGGSRGNVINCKNYGDIYMARKVYGYGAVGGIAGSLENAQIRRK